MKMGKTNGQWLEIWKNVGDLIIKQGRAAVEEYAKGLNIKHCRATVTVTVYENYETGKAGVNFTCEKCDRTQNIEVHGYRFKSENPVSMDFIRECLEEMKQIKPELNKYSEAQQMAMVELAWILFNAYGSYEEADAALKAHRDLQKPVEVEAVFEELGCRYDQNQ